MAALPRMGNRASITSRISAASTQKQPLDLVRTPRVPVRGEWKNSEFAGPRAEIRGC
jgi:hypothetical protein